MNEARRESSWKYLGMRFPERQIYIRSEGRVHFCTFSPLAQAILAGASLLCLGWVAFTTVNVVFKDRIISAKERHFEQMQASYEGRIAELQLAYDELNGVLIAAQDRFKSVADEFEAKQFALTGLHRAKEDASRVARDRQRPGPEDREDGGSCSRRFGVGMSARAGRWILSCPTSRSPSPPRSGWAPAQSMGSIAPYQVAPEPHRAPFLRGAVQRLGSLFGHRASAAPIDNPAIHEISQQEARVVQLDASQQSLLADAKKEPGGRDRPSEEGAPGHGHQPAIDVEARCPGRAADDDGAHHAG